MTRRKRLWFKLQLWLAKCGAYIVINGKTSWEFERLYEQRYGKFWSIEWDQRTYDDDAPLYGGGR